MMKNNKKEDNITVNIISPPSDVKISSNTSVKNAQEAPFCIYAGMRHAVGSIIKNNDGSEVICTENGSWQNS